MAPFAHEVTASALFAIAFGVTSPLLQHYDVPRRIALSEDAAVSLAIFGWLLLFLSPAFRAATRCATINPSFLAFGVGSVDGGARGSSRDALRDFAFLLLGTVLGVAVVDAWGG